MIRSYKTNVTKFLLYPTVNYAIKDGYLNSFQDKYSDFIKVHSFPDKKGDRVLIKYFATVEEIIEKPVSRIPSAKNYIWTRDHVKNYITGKTAYIWVLRVYKLKEPHWAKPTPGAIKYANLKEEVSLAGIKPVLSNSEFDQNFQI